MSIKLNQALMMELGFSRADIAAFSALVIRSGIADSSVTALDNQKQFEEFSITNVEAVEALRGVDELRNEIANIRSDVSQLRGQIADIEIQPAPVNLSLINSRLQTIEDRLA